MNSSEANQINIADYLLKSGIQPTNTKGRNLWYISPIRDEKTPSFKVDLTKNLWFDFGMGAGGSIIDLVCQMHRVDFRAAIQILSGKNFTAINYFFDQQKSKIISEPPINIQHIQQLQNRALIQYLESRRIPGKIAFRYIEEAYYTVKNLDTGKTKKYFALAFKNDLSGYELRNPKWKGGNSPKSITTIPGTIRKVNVIEGFMDFLSALVYFKQSSPGNTTIILNSVSHLKQIQNQIRNFDQINLFLDNDAAGMNAANQIISLFPSAVNQSQTIFPEFKDFNEYLMKSQQ